MIILIVILCLAQSFRYLGNISLYISALFVRTITDPDYNLHGPTTAATHPYKNLTADNAFCRSDCLNDDLCNGYSIDMSNNGCFLSRCTNHTSVRKCITCYFASKKTTTSTDICLPASTTTQMTTNTHMTTTTTLLITTTMMSTETATTSDSITPLDAATSTETVTPLETATTSESITPLDTATSTETTTPVVAATSKETTTLLGTPATSESITPMDAATSTETSIKINNVSCYCVCREVNQTLHQSNEERIKKLTINKRELSSQIRKLHSAPDYRISSKMIGSVAIIILVVAGMLIILADISSILSVHSKKKSKKRKINKFV